MTVLLSWCPAAWALCWNVRTMDAVVFAFISFFSHFSPSLLFASFFFNHASVSWFFCCASFIASSLTLSSNSLALLLPVCWDGSRTAGSVLQSSVSGFNIPIQSPLAVFSHPGTLSLTLLLLFLHHISLY